MFKIFALVVFLASGSTLEIESRDSFPTKEACEAAMPTLFEAARQFYAERGEKVEIGGACVAPGQPI